MKIEFFGDYYLASARYNDRSLLCEGVSHYDAMLGMIEMMRGAK